MLADEVLSSKGVQVQAGKAMADLDRYIHEAHRFDLTEAFASAACEVAWHQGEPALAKTIGICRLPYEAVWIEVADAHRQEFVRIGADRGMAKRVGFLLHARNPEHSIFDAHLFWSANGQPTVAAGFSMIIDLENDRGEKRYAPYESPFSTVVAAHAKSGRSSLGYEQYRTSGVADWAGEVNFLVATLALLNSRRATKIVEPSKMKMRKAGKRQLLSYRICDLDVSAAMPLRDESSAGHCAKRAHFVRGHFKAKSSGLRWWKPHIRGDRSLGFVTKSYSLQNGDA
ncbi:hypothetical protein N8A98_07020 [Devosia neptuniae]|uniref:Transposase DDE domain-containing protein n=1 Tax=Devosia neptuniae TaxID=191302 RepID=A0ABY6CLM7_9HYPH|nr:hypothetical protein [Devosia neptuniae]UXN70933.1 hypothetical protein N8A98_07020 [Devosia neptuniae]